MSGVLNLGADLLHVHIGSGGLDTSEAIDARREADVRDFAARCLPQTLGALAPDDICVRVLAGGTSNQMYHVFAPTRIGDTAAAADDTSSARSPHAVARSSQSLPTAAAKAHAMPQQHNHHHRHHPPEQPYECVVRVFGAALDGVVDRDAEILWQATTLRCYGRCANGCAIEYLRGYAPIGDRMSALSRFAEPISRSLAEFHLTSTRTPSSPSVALPVSNFGSSPPSLLGGASSAQVRRVSGGGSTTSLCSLAVTPAAAPGIVFPVAPPDLAATVAQTRSQPQSQLHSQSPIESGVAAAAGNSGAASPTAPSPIAVTFAEVMLTDWVERAMAAVPALLERLQRTAAATSTDAVAAHTALTEAAFLRDVVLSRVRPRAAALLQRLAQCEQQGVLVRVAACHNDANCKNLMVLASALFGDDALSDGTSASVGGDGGSDAFERSRSRTSTTGGISRESSSGALADAEAAAQSPQPPPAALAATTSAGVDLKLIDFEYAGPNYTQYDIGSHWAETAGLELDWSRFPSVSHQRRFVASYLRALTHLIGDAGKTEQPDAVALGSSSPVAVDAGEAGLRAAAAAFAADPDGTVERWRAASLLLVLVSHVGWTAWAVFQAAGSQIDFDYLAYAARRWEELERRFDEWIG
jgi:thiamine kinase-like enzyme